MSSQENPLLERLENRVLTITLNRPASKNAITAELNVRLHDAVMRAAVDDRVGAVVLTGAGGAFCAGGDIKNMAQPNAGGVRAHSTRELLEQGGRTTLELHRMPKPTIAMIRGAAAGGGLALALGCDLRLADSTAKFTYAYTNIGLSGDFGCAWLLQKWLGPAKARAFCLLCPVLGASDALAAGLLNELVPDGDLEDRVYRLASQLANGPTGTLGRIKANLDAAATMTAAEYLSLEADNFLACRDSPEHREALTAFSEKRKPSFH